MTSPDRIHRAGLAALAAVCAMATGAASDDGAASVRSESGFSGWTVIGADGTRQRATAWSLSASGDTLEVVPEGGGDSRSVRVDRRSDRRLDGRFDGQLEGGFESAPNRDEATALAISRTDGSLARGGPHLVLQSGERLPGRPDLVDGEIVWRHAWLGDFAVDLERLRSLVLTTAPDPGDADADVVTLANGDRLEGFVVDLGGDVVVERLDDGSRQRVPVERVARLDLVEDPQPPAPIRLWTRDGTVVDLEDLRGTRGDGEEDPEARLFAFERRGGEGRGRSEGVVFARETVAVAWHPSSIEPLARFGFETSHHPDAPDRGWLPSPTRSIATAPFDAVALELTGPARFETRVPQGSILSTEAELPEMMRRFGDFELRILDGDRERLRRRFSRGAPRASIAVPIESGRLVIELGPGLHGPVQDRLRLTTPLLVRSRPASE